jgi:hypothetical protein
MPGKTQHIPETFSKHRSLAALNIEPQIGCFFICAFKAGITGTANIDMQCTVGSKAERAPTMLTAVGQVDDDGFQFAYRAIIP